MRVVLRLRLDARPSVQEVARRAAAGRSTLLTLNGTELSRYGQTGTKQRFRRCPEPGWAALNREQKRRHASL